MQSLNASTYDDAPNLTVARSGDRGVTWEAAPLEPMFDDHLFTTVMFLDRGQDGAAAGDGFVYAYGLDQNWRYSGDPTTSPTRLYLARVPTGTIQTREAWEFFTGLDADGAPTFSPSISDRQPVIVDETVTYAVLTPGTTGPSAMTRLSQGSVVYDAPLGRYLYTSWTEYTFELYDAPAPWGPWQKLLSFDFGVHPWSLAKNGGYALGAPSKFISSDGKTLWVQSNSWGSGVDNNHFSLRRLHLEPWAPSLPTNARGSVNLAREGDGVTAFVRATHTGDLAALNDDDVTTADDSATGEAKTEDFWGYTFTHAYAMNRLTYVTGAVSVDGGWFASLRVEVRQEHAWVDVGPVAWSAAYSFDATVPSFASYELSFADTWGDGVRIVGTPGGAQAFTSIAELGVGYE